MLKGIIATAVTVIGISITITAIFTIGTGIFSGIGTSIIMVTGTGMFFNKVLVMDIRTISSKGT
jgi:hypothetical protein